MLVPDAQGRVAFNPSIDRERIAEHVANHQARFAELLRLSLVPSMVLLKVLLHFQVPALHVKAIAEFDMSNIVLWQKCAAALGVPP